MVTLQRLPAVLAANGDAKSTFCARIAQGLWTKPVKLSKHASAWPDYETDALNAARIAGKSDEEIRELVKQLHAARLVIAGKTSQEIRELVKELHAARTADNEVRQ